MTDTASISQPPFLVGDRIYLRAVRPSDVSAEYLSWLNDAETTRYLETGIFPCTGEELRSYLERLSHNHDAVFLAIIDKAGGQHIGNVKLDPISWIHRRAVFGILIGNKAFRGMGIGTEVTRMVLHYAFNRLNLNKIVLGVYADHAGAVRAYEKVGFQIEGHSRQELFRDGEYRDRLWMGILRSDYMKLEGSGEQSQATADHLP